MKLVSIAICTYNGEKYLKEQLDSLLNQTHSNIEIIVVDDGSKDSTMKILNDYQIRDSRIKVFQNEQNLGFVQNFSKAISLCTGDYIALADQDDIWKLNKLEKFIADIGDNILIYSDAILIDQNGDNLNEFLLYPKKNLVSGHCNKAFLFNNCVSGNTLMFKKELVKHILPIPEISFHDTWIAYVASSLGTITYTNDAMTLYRRHTEQITVKKKSNRLNFLNRFKNKMSEKKQMAINGLRDLNAYKKFALSVDDLETIKILDLLLDHYNNFDSIFINERLYTALLPYKNELMAIFPENRKNKRFKNIAYGMKFHLLTLFSK